MVDQFGLVSSIREERFLITSKCQILMHVEKKLCCLLTVQCCLFKSPVALLSLSHQGDLKDLKSMHLFSKQKQNLFLCTVNTKCKRSVSSNGLDRRQTSPQFFVKKNNVEDCMSHLALCVEYKISKALTKESNF